jgi:hypothetical protein
MGKKSQGESTSKAKLVSLAEWGGPSVGEWESFREKARRILHESRLDAPMACAEHYQWSEAEWITRVESTGLGDDEHAVVSIHVYVRNKREQLRMSPRLSPTPPPSIRHWGETDLSQEKEGTQIPRSSQTRRGLINILGSKSECVWVGVCGRMCLYKQNFK